MAVGDGGRLVTRERRAALEACNAELGGILPAHDLDVIAHLGVTDRRVAEHLIWDDRDAVLTHFDTLVRAAAGERPAPAGETARYEELRAWRDQHADPAVRAISDADVGRLATARITQPEDLGRAAAGLANGRSLMTHVEELLQLLGVQRPPAAQPGSPASQPAAAPAPTPAPSPEPQPEPEPEPDVPDPSAPFEWVQVTRFKGFDWTQGAAEPVGHVVGTTTDDGQVQLEWTPLEAQAPVTLYRIVQSPDSWPTGAPEMASPVGVTTATAGTVRLQPRGQVTYLAVWANQGDSVLAASQSQPVLVGSTEVVWPPTSITVNVTPDKGVAASWRAPEGSRVEVQRFPDGIPVQYDQSRLLPPEAVSTGGFIDHDAPQGRPVVYAAFCVAELPSGGSAISEPTTASITITPDAEQIRLDVKRSATTAGAYDLTWMPPRNGRVVLFATRERPPQGLEREPRTREILESQGITSEYRITYPANDLGGIQEIKDFVVDDTWVRTHFFAVHWVTDELVWMGPPVAMVTPRAPRWAEVIERVDAQVLTFPWPDGVSIVEAYQSPRGAELDPHDNEPIAQLTREEYDKTGGMRVTRTLPSNGCTLHLFGVVYLDGEAMYSRPVTVDYAGITRMRYELVPMLANQQEAPPGVTPAFHRLFCTVDDELHAVPIVLAGHEQRLPLEPGDGTIIQEAVVSLSPEQRVFVGDLPLGRRPMFVRLFVHRPAAETGTIAVLDPRVETLRMWV